VDGAATAASRPGGRPAIRTGRIPFQNNSIVQGVYETPVT
jgi:hypothetical protein